MHALSLYKFYDETHVYGVLSRYKLYNTITVKFINTMDIQYIYCGIGRRRETII